jgi:hypothetical protein
VFSPFLSTLSLTLSEDIADAGTLDSSAWSITTDGGPAFNNPTIQSTGTNTLVLDNWTNAGGLGLFDRVSFTGGGGPVVGVSGGTLQPFANFPLSVI